MEVVERKPFLSIAEAAKLIGVSTSTGYNLAAAGELPLITLRGVKRIPAAALEQWMAARADEALASVRRAHDGP